MNKSSPEPATLAEPVKEKSAPPLKVLIVVEPGSAGTFGHVEGLVHFLIERGQRVFLAYSSKRPGPNQPALINFVNSHGGKCLDLNVGNAPCAGDLSAFFRLRSLANEIQPDVIHSHSSKAGVLARALALAGIKCRQLYTPHAYYGLADRGGLMNTLYNKVETVFGHVGQTINVSEDERDFAVKGLDIEANRCLLIPIAVDTKIFSPPTPEERKSARAKMNLPPDGPVLGWIGRISYQKDPETLYRAFGLLLQQGKPCHLLHVGKGDATTTLDQISREFGLAPHITRISYIDDTLDFYHAIDGLILNSRYEGCPSTALEALAVDLPVILSKAPGTKWLTQCDLSHSWSAAPGDAAGFADATAQWLADLPKHRPSNHRTFTLERLSITQMYGQILEAYRTHPACLAS